MLILSGSAFSFGQDMDVDGNIETFRVVPYEGELLSLVEYHQQVKARVEALQVDMQKGKIQNLEGISINAGRMSVSGRHHPDLIPFERLFLAHAGYMVNGESYRKVVGMELVRRGVASQSVEIYTNLLMEMPQLEVDFAAYEKARLNKIYRQIQRQGGQIDDLFVKNYIRHMEDMEDYHESLYLDWQYRTLSAIPLKDARFITSFIIEQYTPGFVQNYSMDDGSFDEDVAKVFSQLTPEMIQKLIDETNQ
ncbi:MAG: hypothetical protein QNK37_24115 [Acidobacteriota bacterium]|nr:hypothetical protein [Acidobacteriota bacterium]